MTALPRPTRPLLRYHGGKWRIAPWIVRHIPPHQRYVEPFAGAASVLIRKPRAASEILNDLDGELVNLFRVVRDQGAELRRMLELTPYAREEFAESYEQAQDPIEQARRTLVRSWMGFGSAAVGRRTGFRVNSRRNGGMPSKEWSTYPDALPAIIERLRGVVIEHRDALDVIRANDGPGTLHYVDPPYPASVRDEGRDYRYELSDDDHCELAEALHGLRGAVMVSGYDCPLYRDLYRGWRIVRHAAVADRGGSRTECLWLSPACRTDELPISVSESAEEEVA